MGTFNPFQASTTISLAAVTTAASLPNMSTKYVAVSRGFFSFETAPVRIGFGGLTPTSVNGHRFDIGDTLEVDGWTHLNTFKHIRGGATDAVIWFTPLKHQR